METGLCLYLLLYNKIPGVTETSVRRCIWNSWFIIIQLVWI